MKGLIQNLLTLFLLIATALFFGASAAGGKHTSSPFQGPKANTGTATHWKDGNKNMLTLSDDFVVPDTPDPHIQVVDSKGNVYLLNRCMIKGDKINKTIEVPAYVKDIAKVQIWCAFAETLLGEASFEKTVQLTNK